MNRKKIKGHEAYLLAALVLFFFIGAAFFTASSQINTYITESCFRSLEQSTQRFCRELQNNVESSRGLLEITAEQLAAFPSLQAGGSLKLLSSLENGNRFSQAALLLPGDRILRPDGSVRDCAGILSFTEEAPRGYHISARRSALDGSGNQILLLYYPVVRDGETAALLCGTVDLQNPPGPPLSSFEEAHALLYVIEGKSGNFLVDTLHSELGNISMLEKEAKAGYDARQVSADIAEGRAGRAAFYSRTSGEYLYCGYAPAGVNDWMVMFTLPESVVLAGANQIRLTLYLLAGLEGACLTAYFAWVLLHVRKGAAEKQSQLNRARYMLDVEESLFGAARIPRLMETALQKVAAMLKAESAFFLVKGFGQEAQRYCWPENARKPDAAQAALLLSAGARLKKGLLSYSATELAEKYGLPAELGSLMLVPARDSDDVMTGVLGAAGLSGHWRTTELLESVVLSFSMAARNLESFRTIREMGMMDQLTGLLNRNSFQQAVEVLEKSPDDSLGCIYIDADGLHELNNRCGHITGDRMLQIVADTLKAEFGADCIYRIGGDEFVVFSSGRDADGVNTRLSHIRQALEEYGYHISAGVEWRRNASSIDELIKGAEAQMYKAKQRYYESSDAAGQIRVMNQELEELLMEKRDLDVFRAALAFKYLGVYILELKFDTIRAIYIPAYFENFMRDAGGRFSAAIRSYVADQVLPEQRPAFLRLTDYAYLEKLLDHGEEPELFYQKRDGSKLRLLIRRSPEYSWRKKECIWYFETVPEEKG